MTLYLALAAFAAATALLIYCAYIDPIAWWDDWHDTDWDRDQEGTDTPPQIS